MISPEFFSEENRNCLVSTYTAYSLVEERGHMCLFLFTSTTTKTRLHSDNQEKLHSNMLIYSECYFQPGYTLIAFILAQILLLGYVSFSLQGFEFPGHLIIGGALWYYELLRTIWGAAVLCTFHCLRLCSSQGFHFGILHDKSVSKKTPEKELTPFTIWWKAKL